MTTTDGQATDTMIAAEALYARILSGEPLFILDVRNEDEYRRMRVEGRDSLESINIPYYEFIEDEDGMCARVPADREVLVVCAKEGSSQYVAGLLQERGVRASYLQGGFASWGNFYDVRDVVSAGWGRIVQIARPARGDLSFALISDGEAALIDPLRHIDVYQRALAEAGATLTHIFDTHVHADHISGGPALSEASGATYYVHAYDAIHPIDMLPARIAYTTMEDGQQFRVGQATITAIWYPGHTLGQMNYLATAPDGGRYMFTGDGIFLRSFGRPDLGGRGEAWTPMLYESMFRRLPPHLTDATMILPAHFSAMDEDAGGGIFAEPYGALLAHNDALRPRSLEEFTAFVLGHLPVFPPEYVEIKRVNIGLAEACEGKASELELGKNICALAK